MWSMADRPSRKDRLTPEERVAEALAKALENTTPERPGTPWGGKQEIVDEGRRFDNAGDE
jgi:hypothetical protein